MATGVMDEKTMLEDLREARAALEKRLEAQGAEVDKLKKDQDGLGKLAGQIEQTSVAIDKLTDRIRRFEQRSDLGGAVLVRGINRRTAEAFGHAVRAIAGNRRSQEIVEKEFGFRAAVAESTEAAGGVLVPTELRPEIIRLVEQFGVIRANARVVPMASAQQNWPVRTSGPTVYNPAEAGTLTASQLGFAMVNLVARKWGCLVPITSEIAEDATIDIGALVVQEMGQALAEAEDSCGFIGDGTSTYFGIQGIVTALAAGSKVTGSGNAWSELAIADFESVVGTLPDWPGVDADAKWFVHRKFYFTVMLKVALALGGANATEALLGVGGQPRTFLGYPVIFSQKMPKAEANSQVCAIFGSMRQSVLLGDRRELTIRKSDAPYFAQDMLAIQGLQRLDINCHSRGDASNAGGLIGLVTAAS